MRGAMIDNTINDDRTVAGGGKDMILAGRYHILRQLGQGGKRKNDYIYEQTVYQALWL